jgi:diphthine-ammonia ligase
MKVGVLFSGGKDSSLALYKAKHFHEVVCLVSLISENPESYMFHVPNIELTEMQAEAVGLPIIKKMTKGEKEDELKDLRETVVMAKTEFGIKGIVTGAIKSVYQASRIQKICNDLGLWCFNPLWLQDPIEILDELVRNNFRVIISGVFAFPLDATLLGKTIDLETIEKLRRLSEVYNLNPAGEGGEMETTVVDAPFFKKSVKILDSVVSFKNNSGTFRIKKARLVAK